MPTELKMPALSPTMEEGTLAKWLVKEGDVVKSGDLLAEIETDKATMEFEAVDEGTIGKILVPEGSEGVKVGAAIAMLIGDGEDASAAPAPAAAPAPLPTPKADPTPKGRSRPGTAGARWWRNTRRTVHARREGARRRPHRRIPPRAPPRRSAGHRPGHPQGQRPGGPHRPRRPRHRQRRCRASARRRSVSGRPGQACRNGRHRHPARGRQAVRACARPSRGA